MLIVITKHPWLVCYRGLHRHYDLRRFPLTVQPIVNVRFVHSDKRVTENSERHNSRSHELRTNHRVITIHIIITIIRISCYDFGAFLEWIDMDQTLGRKKKKNLACLRTRLSTCTQNEKHHKRCWKWLKYT